MKETYDLIIVGGGSAGVGACLAAAAAAPERSILLVERDDILGGTSTVGGVHNWEPGIASGRIHAEIARRLLANGQGCVGKTISHVSPDQPMAISAPCQDPYASTQRRAGLIGEAIRRFHFEPQGMAAAMAAMISEHPNVTVFMKTTCSRVQLDNRQVCSVVLQRGLETLNIKGKLFIDATADIIVARDAGCAWSYGQEASDVYDEPSAPDTAGLCVNAVSLIFRVTAKVEPGVDPIPSPYDQADVRDWMNANFPNNLPVSFVTQYPDGDYCFNMLPTMEGDTYSALPEKEAYEICKARVYHYFQWLQSNKNMARFCLRSIADRVGVRETYRLKAQYVLNENDIRAPFGMQPHFTDVIAFADHAVDIHGREGACHKMSPHLKAPYGIPYSCLLPRELDNLLVACRGSGFTHIAASSSRLSRTMMALGEAAGTAAALCFQDKILPAAVDRAKLQNQLQIAEQTDAAIRKYGLLSE
jgi:hypothetical protein